MERQGNDLQSGNGDDSVSASNTFAFSCPYLGTLEDPDTSLAFPSAGNHCFRVKSPAAVDFTHQKAYCLTERHPGCHVFQKAIIPAAVPETGSTDFEPAEEQKRRVSLYALPLTLILILLAALVWWPAPGSNIQDALVLGDQAQEKTGEDTNLTGGVAAEPVAQTSAVEVESADLVEATAPATSLRESATQKEEDTRSNNEVESAARGESVPSEVPVQADNASNPAAQAQAAKAAESTRTTGDSQAESADDGKLPSVRTETATVTLSQPEPSTEVDASAELEIESPESSANELGSAITAAAVGREAPTANIEDVPVTVAAEEVEQTVETVEVEQTATTEEAEQTAETEAEPVSVSIADLPIIAAQIVAVASAPVVSSGGSAGSEQVVFVGPGLKPSSALGDNPDSGSALSVRRSPSNNGDLITLVDQREAVTLLGRDSSYSWLKIRLLSGVEGWVNAIDSQSGLAVESLPEVNENRAADTPSATEEIVTNGAEPIASSNPIIKSAVVDAGALNLRSGPGVEYEPLTIIGRGTSVGLVGRHSSGPWVRIRLDDGVEGWVNSSLLAAEG